MVLELKILRGNLDQTLNDGIAQATAYAQQCGADEVHLILFSRNPAVSWDERIWQQTVQGGH